MKPETSRDSSRDGAPATPPLVDTATPAGFAPHAQPVETVVEHLGSDARRGLTAGQVAERRGRHGPNELAGRPAVPRWRKFLRQFRGLVIGILLLAAAFAALTGEWADAFVILAIVILNAVLGFAQETRAEQALAGLQRLSAPTAKVLRGGTMRVLPARELVPGDCIELAAGDQVPADARLVQATGLRVQEAALTGESEPEDKDPGTELGLRTALPDRRNMVYLGTVAVSGKARAIVVATGMDTELGRIAGMLQRHEPEPTPLQRRLGELGRVISVGCLLIASGLFVVELLRGRPWSEVLLLSVSLAVAAVPEGLPAVVTVALALGLQRLAKRNALVRNLSSVETLGCVTVICSDKTGTLTHNEMTVREIIAGDVHYRVTGTGYEPHGQIFLSRADDPLAGKECSANEPVDTPKEPDLLVALTIAARCNNAQVVPHAEHTGVWQVIGDPTEGALLVAALKAGVESPGSGQGILLEIPFDPERKAMSVVARGPDGTAMQYTKGAPEVILGMCRAEQRDGRALPLTAPRREAIVREAAGMAGRALRVLALAYREYPAANIGAFLEQDLIFAGLVGMMDPPRAEAKLAVHRCREAGIRPIMITGDHPSTALAIARELHIAQDDAGLITGAELAGMSADALATRVEEIAVYARASAEDKLRVVQAWKRRGAIVAMTGDGVNDAPAVQAADIGIAMGLSGTDVTRQASALVLADDNFASIVNAVEEGRGILDNIQKFLHYLLAGNLGLVLFVFLTTLAGWPFPLTATQILWMNLVTNGLPALALGMEPPEHNLMRRRPRPPREPVLTLRRGVRTCAHGLLVALVTVAGFALVYQGEETHLARARTMAFCVISLAFVGYALSCRSQHFTVFKLGLFSNPHLLGAIVVSSLLQLGVVTLPFTRSLSDTVTLGAWEWALLVVLALAPVTLVEVLKLPGSWQRSGPGVFDDGTGTSPHSPSSTAAA